MPKKKTSSPRQYGRQAEGKTIKSLSLETDVANWAEEEAKKRGMSFSAFVNAFLKGNIKVLIFLCLLSKLIQGPTDWSGEALAASVGQGCSWFGTAVGYVLGSAWELGGALLAAI